MNYDVQTLRDLLAKFPSEIATEASTALIVAAVQATLTEVQAANTKADSTNTKLDSLITSANAATVSEVALTAGTVTAVTGMTRQAAITAVASAAADTQIIASNSRKGVILMNDSTSDAYVLVGTGTASSTNFSFKILAGEDRYLHVADEIRARWITANGFMRVTPMQ